MLQMQREADVQNDKDDPVSSIDEVFDISWEFVTLETISNVQEEIWSVLWWRLLL